MIIFKDGCDKNEHQIYKVSEWLCQSKRINDPNITPPKTPVTIHIQRRRIPTHNNTGGTNMGLTEFQNDLNQGMTITEALQKHQLTLEYAFHQLQIQQSTKLRGEHRTKTLQKRNPHQIYIQENNNRYYIRKRTRGKERFFGAYTSLEDAIKVRDALIEDGWHIFHVDSICERLGVVRSKPKLWKGRRYH